jgi:hypothetical protein
MLVVSVISPIIGVGILPNSGVTELDAVEYGPVPILLTAATLNTYAVPFTKPVTVTDVAVETVSVKVVQVLPLSLEY